MAPRAALKSNCGGHRVLDEVGVDRGVGVEPLDRGQQVGLGAVAGDVEVVAGDADLLARLVLLAHVAGRGGVVADQDRAEPHRLAPLAQGGGAGGDVGEHRLGDGASGEQLCGHVPHCAVRAAAAGRTAGRRRRPAVSAVRRWRNAAVAPPSTRMSVPVRNEASSETMKETTAAISSGEPSRASALSVTIPAIAGWLADSSRPMGVSITPGDSDSRRAPARPHAAARRSTRRRTPRLGDAVGQTRIVGQAHLGEPVEQGRRRRRVEQGVDRRVGGDQVPGHRGEQHPDRPGAERGLERPDHRVGGDQVDRVDGAAGRLVRGQPRGQDERAEPAGARHLHGQVGHGAGVGDVARRGLGVPANPPATADAAAASGRPGGGGGRARRAGRRRRPPCRCRRRSRRRSLLARPSGGDQSGGEDQREVGVGDDAGRRRHHVAGWR